MLSTSVVFAAGVVVLEEDDVVGLTGVVEATDEGVAPPPVPPEVNELCVTSLVAEPVPVAAPPAL